MAIAGRLIRQLGDKKRIPSFTNDASGREILRNHAHEMKRIAYSMTSGRRGNSIRNYLFRDINRSMILPTFGLRLNDAGRGNRHVDG